MDRLRLRKKVESGSFSTPYVFFILRKKIGREIMEQWKSTLRFQSNQTDRSQQGCR